MGRLSSTFVMRAEVHTGFCCENLRVGKHLKDPGVVGRIIQY
jgi:hypothetical protein